MQFMSFTRRRGLAALAAALTAAALPAAHAQETTIKFQLDWRFEGPAALYGCGPRTVLDSNAKRSDEHIQLEDLRRATKVVARTLFDLLS